MRFLVPPFVALTLIGLFIGQSSAQNRDDEKNKRIVQIEMEIRDLGEKIGKLSAELAKLQPPKAVKVVRGMITSFPGGEPPYVLDLDNRGINFLLFNSQVQYADQRPATLSDLRVGQSVSVHCDGHQLSQKKDPASTGVYKVVIEKESFIREIASRNRQQIAKQLDFAKEQLLQFVWTGSSDDKLSIAIEETTAVVFTLIPGKKKTKVEHVRLYSLPKHATWQSPEHRRVPEPTKISSTDELTKTFPDKKQ